MNDFQLQVLFYFTGVFSGIMASYFFRLGYKRSKSIDKKSLIGKDYGDNRLLDRVQNI